MKPIYLLLSLILLQPVFIFADTREFSLQDKSTFVEVGKIKGQDYFIQNILPFQPAEHEVGLVLLRTSRQQPDIHFFINDDGNIVNESGKETAIPSVVKVLFHGIRCGEVEQGDVTLKTDGFVLASLVGNLGRYDHLKIQTTDWKIADSACTLVSKSERDLWEEKRAKYASLLSEGKLFEARRLNLEGSPNGGNDCHGDELNQLYFKASELEAFSEFKKGQVFQAALVASQAVKSPLYNTCGTDNEEGWIYWGGNAGTDTRIKGTSKNMNRLNNMGYFLVEGGFYEDGINVLEIVLNEDPNRKTALLNLADGYWAMGDQYLDNKSYYSSAKRYYKKYKEQLEAAGNSKTIPKRVLSRME